MKYFKLIVLFNICCCWFYTHGQPLQSPCLANHAFTIVVLGSSTAAGAGTSAPNAWVNRYRAHLDSINPANEVINLAVGGFVSYRIMPDNFLPTVGGRPLPDTLHNISEALRRNPDAIIVNLPSNDRQYPMEEQLANFDSLYRWSNRNNVPIWICTTQPVATSGVYQAAVKDSIELQYGFYAIDFWTTLADSNNLVIPFYAADAVHLNALGHAVLYNRVVEKNIPGYLQSMMANGLPDYLVQKVALPVDNLCSDSTTAFQIVIANAGYGDSSLVILKTNIIDSVTLNTLYFCDTIQFGLNSCAYDTFHNAFSVLHGSKYYLNSVIINSSDTVSQNDSVSEYFFIRNKPVIDIANDTVCFGNSSMLSPQTAYTDTVVWFSGMTNDSVIWFGENLITGPLFNDTSFFAQAVSGDLSFVKSLFTTSNSSVNWNGAMFDLYAFNDIVIDSLSLKVNSIGWQVVECYSRNGSHLGHELDSTGWNFIGADSVFVSDPNSFVSINFGEIHLSGGDSVAVYLQMKNPSSTLSYLNDGVSHSRSTAELRINTGSGASHNFSANFYPRDWNGEVHYHHGFNVNGFCSSDRKEVKINVRKPSFDLGADTNLTTADTLMLNGPVGFNSYLWSTGSTAPFIYVTVPPDSQTIWLEADDIYGCTARDTINIGFTSGVNIKEITGSGFVRTYPVPASDIIYFDFDGVENPISIIMIDALGRKIFKKEIFMKEKTELPVSGLASGAYMVLIITPDEIHRSNIVVLH